MESQLALILNSITMRDLAKHYQVHLNDKNAGQCPLCNSNGHPPFLIREAGGVTFFKCFTCGAGGDVIEFVMRKEGFDIMGAINFLTPFANQKATSELPA